MVTVEKKGFNSLNNPEVAMELISALFYGPQRSSAIVHQVMDATAVSEPTVYSALTELVMMKMVEKEEKSRRRVLYKLTEEGRQLLEKEHFGVIEKMLSTVKNTSRKREILVQLLMDDILNELPAEMREHAKKDMLRAQTAEEVEDLKKRLLRIASAFFV
jgi:DNA-binding PadR family transcriptional regulator